MLKKIYLQSLFFFSVFLMIITSSIVYAHGPGGGSGNGNFMGNNSYGMMGGHGMMGSGSMGNFGQDAWDRSRSNDRDNEHRDSNSNYREEIESLHQEIDRKRKELASLYRSQNSDTSFIEKKINALENLERYLDEKIAFQRFGR